MMTFATLVFLSYWQPKLILLSATAVMAWTAARRIWRHL